MAEPDAPAAPDTPFDADLTSGIGGAGEAEETDEAGDVAGGDQPDLLPEVLSGRPACEARRRTRRCTLEVLHAGDHDDGERRWRRGRRDLRRRDALVDAVERLREDVAQPLEG